MKKRDETINSARRKLTVAIGAGAAGAVVLARPRLARADGAASAEELELAEVGELATGEVVEFAYPTDRDSGFLIKLGRPAEGGIGPDGDIVAFLSACPHMGCLIRTVDPERAVFGPCHCHRSRFDIAAGGRQIFGRAAQRLVQVDLEIRGTKVLAIGVASLPFGHALVKAP